VYTAFSIPISMALGLGLALLLNVRLRGLGFYRTAFYLPVVTSMVAISMIWIQLFDPLYGVVSNALESVGIRGVDWLGDPNLAMPSVIAVSVWKTIGWNMLIYLAGLQGIPEYLKEAAAIDGAGRWQIFWKIVLPLLKPTTFFIFVTSVIGAFQVFDIVYVMTGGGPANATLTLVQYVYNNAFKALDMGFAAAASFVLFAIIMAVTLVSMRYVRLRFPGRGVLFVLVLATLMVPYQVTIIPQFVIIRHMPLFGGNDLLGQNGIGWINSYWGLIVPGAVGAFGIFLLRQFFETLPHELEDAARIDGAGELRIFWQIMLPLAMPAVATLAVFSFQAGWNAFLWPLLITTTDDMRTIQLGLTVFVQQYSTQWDQLMAATVVATLPIIAVFAAGQRLLVRGIAFTGLKG
jgi:ABC-type sugar transport system permease subunit